MNASGLSVRTWNDAPISRRDSDGFANATAMCQANGKLWGHYISNQRTTAYIQALADSLGISADQLVITTTTGPNHLRGTWVHPRLAVDLARWLSPQFAVWMDGWFLEQSQDSQNQAHSSIPLSAWDPNTFPNQPPSIRIAQMLLDDADRGGDRALRYWLANRPKPQAGRLHCTVTAPSSKAALSTIQYFNERGIICTTRDIEDQLHPDWSIATARCAASGLKRLGMVCKHGRGWLLTDAGAQMLAATS
jgi:hypothetical protein